jgi:replicative DNA helicase
MSTDTTSPLPGIAVRPNGSKRGDSPRRDWRNMSRLFEQLPPHALEAEMSLLGAMLVEPQVIGDVVMVVRSGEDFFKPANGAIFEAMVQLYDKHAALDIVQLNQLLVDRGALEAVGGIGYLVELAQAVPSAANAAHYARLVREKSMIRQLIETAGEILHDAYTSAEDARAILENAEQQIFRIAQQSEQSQIESLHDLIRQTMQMLEANEGKQLTGIGTGFAELDQMTSGFQKGELIIVAARPSMGKTALALNIAEQIALRGHGIGIFSLEMGRQQLVQRMLAARSGIDSHRLRRNMLRPDDYRALMGACDELLEAPVFIDDTPGLSLLQLRAKARRMAQKHDIRAVIIDYLQLMSSGRRAESRQMEVSEISRGVKAMARELNVPVVCLSQLNRAAEQREGHRPRMSDLRESGSIEQDADVIAMLHREEYYHRSDPRWAEDNPEKLGVAELILAKQRNGPTGTVMLSWIEQSMRFRDHSPAHPPGGMSMGGYDPPPAARSGRVGDYSPTSAPFTPNRPPTGPAPNFRDGGGPEPDDFDDDVPL